MSGLSKDPSLRCRFGRDDTIDVHLRSIGTRAVTQPQDDKIEFIVQRHPQAVPGLEMTQGKGATVSE